MTGSPATSSGVLSRSTLLTIFAWLLVAVSALFTLSTLLGVVALTADPAAASREVARVAGDSSLIRYLPTPSLFGLHHYYLAAVLRFLSWSATLVASIGLLRRKDWARRLAIALLALGIVVIAYGGYVAMSLIRALPDISGKGQLPPGVGSGMALGTLVTFGVIVVLFTLILWLRSSRVRADFEPRQRAA